MGNLLVLGLLVATVVAKIRQIRQLSEGTGPLKKGESYHYVSGGLVYRGHAAHEVHKRDLKLQEAKAVEEQQKRRIRELKRENHRLREQETRQRRTLGSRGRLALAAGGVALFGAGSVSGICLNEISAPMEAEAAESRRSQPEPRDHVRERTSPPTEMCFEFETRVSLQLYDSRTNFYRQETYILRFPPEIFWRAWLNEPPREPDCQRIFCWMNTGTAGGEAPFYGRDGPFQERSVFLPTMLYP